MTIAPIVFCAMALISLNVHVSLTFTNSQLFSLHFVRVMTNKMPVQLEIYRAQVLFTGTERTSHTPVCDKSLYQAVERNWFEAIIVD